MEIRAQVRRRQVATSTLVLVVAVLSAVVVPAGTARAASPLGTATTVAYGMRDPYALAPAPDGAVWFRHDAPSLGRLLPDGTRSLLPAPGAAGHGGLTIAPDGSAWYTSEPDHLVGRIAPDGTATTWSGADFAAPTAIVAGPDGNVWFTDAGNDTVGSITPAGVVTRFDDAAIDHPGALASDGTGALWFANASHPGGAGLGIGRITTAGVVTVFAVGAAKGVNDLVVGPDHNVWYSTGKVAIGRLTPAGVNTFFPVGLAYQGTTPAETEGIAVGPDGALWVSVASTVVYPPFGPPEANHGWIARHATTGAALSTSTAGLDDPRDLVTGGDGHVWVANAPWSVSFYDLAEPAFISRLTAAGAPAPGPGAPLRHPVALTAGPGPGVRVLDESAVRVGSTVGGWLDHVHPDGAITGTGTSVDVVRNGGAPRSLVTASDGAIWFTGYFLGGGSLVLERIAPDGTSTVVVAGGPEEYPVDERPLGTDSAGNAVYLDPYGAVMRVTPAGARTTLGQLPAGWQVADLAVGLDGSVWVTDGPTAALGRVTPAGTFEAAPTNPQVRSIAIGADGNLWVVDVSGSIRRVSPASTSDAFDAHVTGARNVIAGPDGHLWVIGTDARVGRIALDGSGETVAELASVPVALAAGADGDVWYAAGDRVGRIGTAPVPPHPPSAVQATAGIDRAVVTWDEADPTVVRATVTASPGGQTCEWLSGPRSCEVTGLDLGTAYTFTVTAANRDDLTATSAPSDPVTTSIADMPAGAPFLDDVTWLVNEDVADGYTDGTYRPTAAISRQAMAAFLYRYRGRPDGPAPACAEAPFPDVPTTAPFCGEIAWLVTSGLATGYGDGTFRPATPVSRRAMAAYLYRLAGAPAGPDPACSSPPFTDVPTADPFCGEIAWLASLDIGTGYGDDTFRPDTPVSRGAMAAFLHRFDGIVGS